MWCASSSRLHRIDNAPINTSDANITPSTTVRNLGVTMNNDFSMKSHIVKLSRSCFCSMRRIRGIRRSLTTEAAKTLISSFVCSRIYYCNTVFANLPASTIDRLDDVLHAPARLISGCRKYDHITPVMRDELHWLPIRQRREYKLCLTVFKALHGISPVYIAAMCASVSSLALRSWLHSADLGKLFFIRTNTEFGKRAFAHADPTAWNNTPTAVKLSSTVSAFRSALQTYLFRVGYSISSQH